jgi:hypothetical protein
MAATQDGSRKPVDFDELYPGRFLKGGALNELEKKPLVIADYDAEPLMSDKGKKVKGWIAFQGVDQQLCLNKTNGLCLKGMFGRTLKDWIGKRVALYTSEWAGEPCIRVWGSPDIEADLELEIQLPQRRPIKMTMHAMGGKLKPVAAAPRQELGDDARGQLAAMAAATTAEALMDVEADLAVRTFADHESAVLSRALSKRRKQITDGQ